jgi:hypothetical protein
MIVSSRTTLKRLCILSILALLLNFLILSSLLRLVTSHNHDLNYEELFDKQYSIYIMTHDCGRYTADIASVFDHTYLVPDDHASPACGRIANSTTLDIKFDKEEAGTTADSRYRAKYAKTLQHCASVPTIKCLILEDDIVFVHPPQRTKDVLVEQTLTLFNFDMHTWDCSKRGFGWLPSSHNVWGSQCRIYHTTRADSLYQCVSEKGVADDILLDDQLGQCTQRHGMIHNRFLLIQNSGLPSTFLDRNT